MPNTEPNCQNNIHAAQRARRILRSPTYSSAGNIVHTAYPPSARPTHRASRPHLHTTAAPQSQHARAAPAHRKTKRGTQPQRARAHYSGGAHSTQRPLAFPLAARATTPGCEHVTACTALILRATRRQRGAGAGVGAGKGRARTHRRGSASRATRVPCGAGRSAGAGRRGEGWGARTLHVKMSSAWSMFPTWGCGQRACARRQRGWALTVKWG